MRDVVVVGGDILTPLGDGQSTWQALLAGKTGISLQKFGSLEGEWPLGFIPDLAGEPGSLQRQNDMFKRLLASLPQLSPATQLFCATTKAATDEFLLRSGREEGQPWQVAEELAQRLGIKAGTTVSAACVSGLIAVIQGAMRIKAGECDHALIIGFDLLSQFVLSGFSSLKALSATAARPFAKDRDGLSLGDGAGWILLSAAEVAEPSSVLATLGPWSISCDANHITAPSRYATGLIAALEQIKAEAGDIGGINAHGTATVYNDAMELLAFSKVFAPGMPVCSVKGALGHSLAASGIVETVLSLYSLRDMILPPTVGLEVPAETDCQLSGSEALALGHPSIITCNSGFGGINAALLLKNASNRPEKQ
ncbi:beta-ketoacyl-[acyl-carrier-protein] synthase family protein [Desulfotalea psychrophila]|uniref:Related to 3-oxoacyl-[acyl-carrier-protein] synthase n=1 Tax=Desulfotalea psychrophila (strain LSv54 / DSM 12343) TaxID=177439 RepID=Q6AM56_DESPS|nr:beta-ketoacyl-[acyl-carrier-protein] synthase family protein [Desulfotalea psychrophila]CAG36569.1 related to 3-oxoacyl-[acyl-carrier-protein] synthase [Desulfotalea psychrophila LSv54]